MSNNEIDKLNETLKEYANYAIKLEKRKPTFDYILNDLALSSLLIKCVHSDSASYQEKFDLQYQIKLMQKEIERLNNIINLIKNNIDITIQIIKEQPTRNDEWILERLNGIKNIGELKGE